VNLMLLNRYLSIEIFFVHLGHGLLFCGVIAILALSLPWWASLLLAPLALFSVAGWAYEAWFVLPVATRLWRGESMEQGTGNREQERNCLSGDEING
jgi:hypothetical protein